MGKITVVGLGPGRAGLITREAWELMEKADDLRLRTGIHPTVSALDDAGVKYTTYDHMYETAGSFAELYDSIAKNLADDAKDKDIAVLTCMRNTTRALQKAITQNVGSHDNVIIDTVARIQGLTTDITLFFVPNTSYIRTLEPHLFNVATSRAKEHTIIIADKNLLEYPIIKPAVRTYLEKLKSERYIYIPARSENRKELMSKYLLE